MEEFNLKIKFKLSSIFIILNTLSNDLINHLTSILDLKMKI